MNNEELFRAITELKEIVFGEMHGKAGPVVGAVLAEATATWLMGHRPHDRKRILELQIKTIKELMKVTQDPYVQLELTMTNDEALQLKSGDIPPTTGLFEDK